MYHAAATLAFVLLVVGWTQRRRRGAHVPLVLLGIGIDLVVVVALEVQRDVVAATVGESHGVLQSIHIGASAFAVLLYLPTLVLGVLLLRGRVRVRAAHGLVAVLALLLRAVGFACMWAV
jgi:uncharacterized protein (TIGR03382 family)